MALLYYRYVGEEEKQSIEGENLIHSRSGATYFTPDRYDSAGEAQKRLALQRPPVWRIGGIAGNDMPELDRSTLRVVAPLNGQPGGGKECTASRPVRWFPFYRLG